MKTLVTVVISLLAGACVITLSGPPGVALATVLGTIIVTALVTKAFGRA